MADINRLVRYLSGELKGFDLSANTLVMNSLKLSTTELTKTILDKLILINTAADGDGTFDTRYTTSTLLASTSNGEGASLIGVEAIAGLSGTDAQAVFSELKGLIDTAQSTADAALPKAGGTMTGDISMGGNEVTGLPATPTLSSSAVSKAYVDAVKVTSRILGDVVAATTANIDLSSMPAAIDGFSLTSGDRFLAKDQTDATTNGVYVFNGAASAATRAEDQDNSPANEILNGVWVPYILNGTLNGGKSYVITSVGTGTDNTHQIGVDDINWSVFSSPTQLTAGDGVDITTNVISVELATDPGLEFATGALRVKIKASSGLVRDADGLYVDLADFDTDDLAEGATNLYFTDTRARTAAVVNSLAGSQTDQAPSVSAVNAALASISSGKNVITGLVDEAVAADTTFAFRFCLTGETAGRVKKASKDISSTLGHRVIGLGNSASSLTAGDSISITTHGEFDLGSSDTPFNANDVGKEVYLTTSGAITVTPPSDTATDEAVVEIGYIMTTTKIFVNPSVKVLL